jgi:uncharacterized membrane protein
LINDMNSLIDHALFDSSALNRSVIQHRSGLAALVRPFTITAAIGAAAVGGVFVAFSTFVMKALKQLPDAQGLAAMQSINKAAPSPAFMGLLFGTAAVCVGLAVRAFRLLAEPGSKWALAASALYLAGIVLTAAYHVPLNDALARLDPASVGSVSSWHAYLAHWTAWNHVRALTSLSAAVAFVLAALAD